MRGKALIGKDVKSGAIRMFESAVDAARALGVSQQAVSSAVKGKGVCRGLRMRYVPRLFVAKLRSGELRVVTAAVGGAFEVVGEKVRIGRERVERFVDVTEEMWGSARDL